MIRLYRRLRIEKQPRVTLKGAYGTTGGTDTRVTIPGGGGQTFLIAFTAKAPFTATNVVLAFSCANQDAAPTIVGVNTLLLTFDSNPVADVIAVGLTPSNDGYARTGGATGTGIFVTAATNIGASEQLTARVRVSDATLPVTTLVCETFSAGPNMGQCKAPASPAVTRIINQHENTTWTAFLAANGAISQDSAHNRIYFEFLDVTITTN